MPASECVCQGQKVPSAGLAEQKAAAAAVEFSARVASALASSGGLIPEVRWARVEALRETVKKGTYQVSSELLATAMLNDLFGRV